MRNKLFLWAFVILQMKCLFVNVLNSPIVSHHVTIVTKGDVNVAILFSTEVCSSGRFAALQWRGIATRWRTMISFQFGLVLFLLTALWLRKRLSCPIHWTTILIRHNWFGVIQSKMPEILEQIKFNKLYIIMFRILSD